VRASARGVAIGRASRKVSRAGKATLTVTPSRTARRWLRSRGPVMVSLKGTYKPAAGGAVTRKARRAILRWR
jgi:hypothetical protein